MGKAERQEQEREAMRNLILTTAGELLAEKGIRQLSIRRIAERMEYSAGIIYHYFQGKEEIVEQLLQRGYRELMGELIAGSEASPDETSPEECLRRTLRQFIKVTTAEGSQYQSMMLNDSPSVLSHTGVLHQGAALERSGIASLCETLRQFSGMASCGQRELELTAQIIWSAAFGLIMRLMVEENLPEAQKDALINRHIEAMVHIAQGSGD